MSGDEGDGEAGAGQEHGEVFDPAPCGEKLRLAGVGKSDFVEAGLVDGPGDDRVNFPGEGEFGGFFQGGLRGARARRSRSTQGMPFGSAQDPVIGLRQLARGEGGARYLWADARGIAHCDSDAWARHARRARISLLQKVLM